MLQKSLNVPDVFLQNFRCCFEKKFTIQIKLVLNHYKQYCLFSRSLKISISEL